MKRIIAVALLITMLATVSGCSLFAGSPTRGTVSDGVYTNTYFGLSFTLPDGWAALSDEDYLEIYSTALPTDEELAEAKVGFGDGFFYETGEGNGYISIWYDNSYGRKTTDLQIKNRLAVTVDDAEFGDVTYFKIGDNDYAMISAVYSDGLQIWYCWSEELTRYLRPMVYIQLDSGESVSDILANFSLIEE